MTAPFSAGIASLARKFAASAAPRLYRNLSYYRNEGRLLRISRKIISRRGPVVLSGPFQGMRYLEKSVGSVLNPKLVGCYEAELHPFFEKVIASNYDRVVDIGCAEGYYAVGLLLRMKACRCIAFDLDPKAQQFCREMAQLNDVSERLTILGCCTAELLQRAIRPRTFILSDCEGAELDLLNPLKTPGLSACDLLIELHDFIRPGLSEMLLKRFAQSHHLHLVSQVDRDADLYPQVSFLSREDRRRAVHEFRPARMKWAVLTSKSSGEFAQP